jgi:FkbM family methyltransferase
MGLASAWDKWRRASRLAADAPSRRLVRAMFVRRYAYPGTALLRWTMALPAGTATLRATHAGNPALINLRPRDAGDRASLYENFIEEDLAALGLAGTRLAVDAGAHIGCFSVALHTLAPSARIVAFEPDPGNAALLEANFRDNAIAGEIRRAAVWHEPGTVKFARGASNAGHIADAGADAVPAETIQGVLGHDLAEVDLVKMDIEGGEMAVLPSLLPVLGGSCRIWLELHDAGRVRPRFDAMLSDAGWSGRLHASYPPHEMWMLSKA